MIHFHIPFFHIVLIIPPFYYSDLPRVTQNRIPLKKRGIGGEEKTTTFGEKHLLLFIKKMLFTFLFPVSDPQPFSPLLNLVPLSRFTG